MDHYAIQMHSQIFGPMFSMPDFKFDFILHGASSLEFSRMRKTNYHMKFLHIISLATVLFFSGQFVPAAQGAEIKAPRGSVAEKGRPKGMLTRPEGKIEQLIGDSRSEPALFNDPPSSSIPVRKALQVEPDPEEKNEGSSAAFLPNTMDGLNDKRNLTSGDRLSFKVVEDESLPRGLTVTDSMEIDVPYLGRVSAVNKTCKQFAYHVKRLLEKEYYFQATVIVGLDSAGSSGRVASRGKFYLMGQVRNQGAMDIPADEVLKVTTAILRAGGFGPYANKRKVRLVRATKDGQKAKPKIIDCAEILDDGLWDKDVEIIPGDVITVPERLINIF